MSTPFMLEVVSMIDTFTNADEGGTFSSGAVAISCPSGMAVSDKLEHIMELCICVACPVAHWVLAYRRMSFRQRMIEGTEHSRSNYGALILWC